MTQYRLGGWLSTIVVILAVRYLLAVLAILLSDKVPPGEPYQSLVTGITLVSVPVLVWLWVIIHGSHGSTCLGARSDYLAYFTCPLVQGN